MRCSASGMFASDNVNSCTCVIRKSIYSLTTRIFKSTNPIVKSIVWGDVYCTSALRNRCISLLCNFDLVRQSLVFAFLLFNYMDTL